MGLYNGKFSIENDIVKGTQIHIDEFKKQIKEIRDGKRSGFPNELPRQNASNVSNSLKKLGIVSSITSAGSFLNGEFMTYDFTWNSSYLPVQMHYNPSNAPNSAPAASTIAGLAI
jgi:hypothetical protein